MIAWDFRTGARLSNQIYLEGYTCTSVACHPTESAFIAQSTAGYIALFESVKPYRLNKKKVRIRKWVLIHSVMKVIELLVIRSDVHSQEMVIISLQGHLVVVWLFMIIRRLIWFNQLKYLINLLVWQLNIILCIIVLLLFVVGQARLPF